MLGNGGKRILILMSDSGGGHRASAEALKAAFNERFPLRFQVDIVDLWRNHTFWPVNRLPNAYRFIATDTPRFYRLLYEVGDRPVVSRSMMDVISRVLKRPISRAFETYNPDLVVSVHPLMQDVPLAVLRAMGKAIPFVAVVTDLVSIHATWFEPEVTLCFVASEEARQLALRSGLQPHQVRLSGLPIRPAFAQENRSRETIRAELGLAADIPLVLLVSGGEGMGPVAEIAAAVARRLAPIGADHPLGQLAVVCGWNTKLHQDLLNRKWPVPVAVNRYVDNMPQWMHASDMIITKAGPGTISEALIVGLPIVLSGHLPGQEEGNVPWVLQHRVGTYSTDPAEIASIVARWLGPERASLEAMRERAKALAKPQAVYEIVEQVAALLPE